MMTAGQSRPPAYDRPQPDSLADLLERVLDKGVVLAGDIRVNLLDIELLTIKIRLLLVSVDKAAEMGIDWWRRDPMLSSAAAEDQQSLREENARLRARLDALENSRPELATADEERPEDQQEDREESPQGSVVAEGRQR